MTRHFLSRLARIWLVVALWDACCATALAVFAYGSTAARLWQGVASTVLGPSALDGGARTVIAGLLLHLGVALAWSALFLALVTASSRLARLVTTPGGIVLVAAVYGPVIWLVMSLVVIPAATGRPPTFDARWWIQVVAHVPFVTLPLVATTAWTAPGRAAASGADVAPAAQGAA
jgi:hypothetical protein